MKFTDRYVRNLKGQEKRYVVWEDGVYGLGNLGLRVSPTGRRTWVFMYRWSGKALMLSLGKYPATTVAEAHRIAAEYQATLDQGTEPGVEGEDSEGPDSVDAIAEDYLAHGVRAGRTRTEFQRILDKEVLAVWRGRAVESIKRREVVDLVDAIAERPAPVAANRTLAVVKAMFNFAIRRGRAEVNPASLIPMRPEEARDRFLSEDELRVLFVKLPKAKMEPLTMLALLLTLASGQRPGEVVAVEWSELEERDEWWTMPPGKRKVGRRGRGRKKPLTRHGVPLSRVARRILAAAREHGTSERWVFPSSRTDAHMTEEALAKAVRRSNCLGLPHWTPHDLRRTAATHMARLGKSRLVVSKVLGHKKEDESVTAIYDRYTYDTEKVGALKVVGEMVNDLGIDSALTLLSGTGGRC